MTIQDDTPQFVTHLSTFAFGKCLFHKYIGKANACSASTSVGCSLRENIYAAFNLLRHCFKRLE